MKKEAFWKRNKCKIAIVLVMVLAALSVVFIL